MKKVYSTAIACFLSLQLLGQSGGSIGILFKSAEKQGDWYYSQMAYLDALQAYQKAYQQQAESDPLKLKIAESLYKLNQATEAERWYSTVQANDSLFTADQMLHYAQVLSSSGNYAASEQWYQRYYAQKELEGQPANRPSIAANDAGLLNKNAETVQLNPASFNGPAADFSPAFYQGGLVFVSGRAGGVAKSGQFKWDKSAYLDLYYLSEEAAHEPRKFSGQINSPYHEGPAVFFEQEQKIIFTRNNWAEKRQISSDGVTKLKLFYSEQAADGNWTKPQALPFNSDEYSTGHPAISQDGSVLYFASDRPGGYGGTDLYQSVYQNGQWQEPVNLGPGVNTVGNEMFPFLHQDRYLYFASNGHAGLGGLDLFGMDLKKSEPKAINLGAPMNTRQDDFALILDDSGKQGYFSSNREGGAGNDDVWQFTTVHPFFRQPSLLGVVSTAAEGKPLAGAQLQLLDEQGNLLATTQSAADGSYVFEAEAGQSYQVRVEKEGYDILKQGLKAHETDGPEKVYTLSLQDKKSYSLIAVIRDAFSQEPIADVRVKLHESAGDKLLAEVKTDAEGDFRYPISGKKPQDQLQYHIRLQKPGYLSKSVNYSTKLGEPGPLELHELLKSSITKLELGMDVARFIQLKPIYFDLGKALIRSDAALELDKVVTLMQENSSIVLELGSHSDARGSSQSNLLLSDKRAQASVAYIISKGIDASRIRGIGYGETQLLNHCQDGEKCSEEEHQQNRRTVLKIVAF